MEVSFSFFVLYMGSFSTGCAYGGILLGCSIRGWLAGFSLFIWCACLLVVRVSLLSFSWRAFPLVVGVALFGGGGGSFHCGYISCWWGCLCLVVSMSLASG